MFPFRKPNITEEKNHKSNSLEKRLSFFKLIKDKVEVDFNNTREIYIPTVTAYNEGKKEERLVLGNLDDDRDKEIKDLLPHNLLTEIISYLPDKGVFLRDKTTGNKTPVYNGIRITYLPKKDDNLFKKEEIKDKISKKRALKKAKFKGSEYPGYRELPTPLKAFEGMWIADLLGEEEDFKIFKEYLNSPLNRFY